MYAAASVRQEVCPRAVGGMGGMTTPLNQKPGNLCSSRTSSSRPQETETPRRSSDKPGLLSNRSFLRLYIEEKEQWFVSTYVVYIAHLFPFQDGGDQSDAFSILSTISPTGTAHNLIEIRAVWTI